MPERRSSLPAALWRRVRSAAGAAWRGVCAIVGPDELGLLIALALVAGGLWWVWKPGALIVPGLVLLWLFLPVRARFVAPAPGDERARGKR